MADYEVPPTTIDALLRTARSVQYDGRFCCLRRGKFKIGEF